MRIDDKLSAWIYIPFLMFVILAAIITLLNNNIPLFLSINTLSGHTGSWFWSNITILGDTLVFTVIFLPFIRKFPQLIYAMLFALIISTLLVQIPKHVFDIPRPPGLFDKSAITIIGPAYAFNAFPSGHSATVFCTYTLFLHVIRPAYGRIILLLFCILVILSRIVVGIHWPLDVAAGAAIGILSGFLAMVMTSRFVIRIPKLLHVIISSLLIISALVLLLFYNSYYDEAFWLQRIIAAFGLVIGIPDYIKLLLQYKTKSEKNA